MPRASHLSVYHQASSRPFKLGDPEHNRLEPIAFIRIRPKDAMFPPTEPEVSQPNQAFPLPPSRFFPSGASLNSYHALAHITIQRALTSTHLNRIPLHRPPLCVLSTLPCSRRRLGYRSLHVIAAYFPRIGPHHHLVPSPADPHPTLQLHVDDPPLRVRLLHDMRQQGRDARMLGRRGGRGRVGGDVQAIVGADDLEPGVNDEVDRRRG